MKKNNVIDESKKELLREVLNYSLQIKSQY